MGTKDEFRSRSEKLLSGGMKEKEKGIIKSYVNIQFKYNFYLLIEIL